MDENDVTEPKPNIDTEDLESYSGADVDFKPLPNVPSCPITGTNDNSPRLSTSMDSVFFFSVYEF
jgi:hypothetical protein